MSTKIEEQPDHQQKKGRGMGKRKPSYAQQACRQGFREWSQLPLPLGTGVTRWPWLGAKGRRGGLVAGMKAPRVGCWRGEKALGPRTQSKPPQPDLGQGSSAIMGHGTIVPRGHEGLERRCWWAQWAGGRWALGTMVGGPVLSPPPTHWFALPVGQILPHSRRRAAERQRQRPKADSELSIKESPASESFPTPAFSHSLSVLRQFLFCKSLTQEPYTLLLCS
jgi:hypothetical protein